MAVLLSLEEVAAVIAEEEEGDQLKKVIEKRVRWKVSCL